MPQITHKVSNTDSTTNKKIIAYLTNIRMNPNGGIDSISYIIRLKETDEVTDAIPKDSTLTAKRAVSAYDETFQINPTLLEGERKISSTTRLYLPVNTVDPNAMTLSGYFMDKIITSLPGVSGTSRVWEFAKGILREVILIKQANEELPV